MAMPPPIATSGRYPSGLGHQTVCAYTTDASNLEDALNSLSLSLEDVRGRYQELQKIEELTDVLRSLLKVRFDRFNLLDSVFFFFFFYKRTS